MDKLVTSAKASTIEKQDDDVVVENPIQKVSVPKIAIASSEDEASAPAAKKSLQPHIHRVPHSVQVMPFVTS